MAIEPKDVLQELRLGARTWMRRPGLAVVIIATLALGIGANVAVFSVIDGVLLQPLPYRHPDRLAIIESRLPQQDTVVPRVTGAELVAMRESLDAADALGAIWYRPGALTDDASDPEDIPMGFISAGFLRALGVEPMLGRFVEEAEDLPNGPEVIVLSHGLWQRRYGGDRDIIGKRIELDDVPHTVVGVMPDGFQMLFPPEAGVPEALSAWVPLGFEYQSLRRGWRTFTVVVRLAEDSDFARAGLQLNRIAADLRERYPEDYAVSGLEMRARPLASSAVAHVRSTLLVLLGAVGFVFLVACANIANLFLVRAAATEHELTLRAALGANHGRIVRQLAIESGVLSVVGAVAGIGVGALALGVLKRLDPADLPRLAGVELGGDVLFVAVCVAVVTALFFGIVSSFHVSRRDALRVGGRTRGDRGRQRVRRGLVVSEIALSAVLLTGAGLLARSFVELSKVDVGFDTSDVVTVKLSLVDSHFPYSQPERIADFYRTLLERLEERTEIRAAGATSQLPLDGSSFALGPYSYESASGPIEWDSVAANYRGVTPGFLEAMGAELIEGRFFDWTDDSEHPTVVVIDDRLAARAFPRGRAVGERLQIAGFVGPGADRVSAEVVGVVRHLKHHPASDGVEQIYIPHAQSPQRTMALAIRSAAPIAEVMEIVRGEVFALDSDQPIHDPSTMTAYLARATAPTRFALSLLTAFSALAVLVAAIGLYGVMSGSVGARTAEIGVRLALGATPANVRRSVLVEGGLLTAAGLAFGVGAALGLSRFMASQLHGVSTTDATTFVAIPIVVALIAMAAIYVPARRASKLSPTLALRHE